MHSARTLLIAILVLSAPAVWAQTPITPEAQAQRLLSATKAGQEADVACGALDAAVGKAFINLGDQARARALERATIAFRLGERAARCAGSEPLLGASLNNLADVLERRGELDAALAASNESIRIHEQLKDDAGLGQAWNGVARVRWARGDRHALDDYQKSLDFFTVAADRPGQAIAFNNIGLVHRALGEFEIAREYQARALRIFEEIGDRRRAAVVTDNIGITYFWRGEYATALEYSRRALEMHRDLGNQYGVGKGLDSVGNIYRALGAYRLALQSFQQALQIRASMGDKPGVVETSHNIGLVHFSQGDYQLAIDAYKRGLRLDPTHEPWFAAEALRNIGAAAWRLGQRARAEADFREGLVIVQREGSRRLEGELLHDLGRMAQAGGRFDEASRLFDRSLAIRRSIGDQAGITESLTTLASARLAKGRHEAAVNLAQQAVANALAHDQRELIWEAQTVVGVAYRLMGRPDDARQALGDAIRSIERLSTEVVGRESLRQRFFEDKLSPYQELIALCVEQRSFGEALELAERSKARTLAELLHGNRGDQSGSLSAAEKQEQRRLRGALFALNRQIDSEQAKPTADESRVNTIESARRAAREDVAAFEARLVSQHPDLAAARGAVTPLALAEASRIITDRKTAIVEYVVADRRLFAFLLTSDGAHVMVDAHAIDISAAELAKQVERFRHRISSRDFGFQEDARALYNLLLGPFKGRLAGKSRLVVVPDGTLWNVPFQALLGPDGYVIEARAVSYTPSLAVVREIVRLPRATGPRTLMAMAKSQFGPASPSALEPLPDAETQVRLIRDLYGPDRSVTYIGNEATEGQFKAAASRYSVLHLATHGVLDETNPLYSYLLLSPARDDPDDDGHLEAWEIMRMRLTADLVVLAACDTGRGRIAPGEGVTGMMWALFAAGARSMVVSQFPVESKSAAALLVSFHRRLAADRGPTAAHLQAAAIELLRTPRYAHPYYWAGFILVGDSD